MAGRPPDGSATVGAASQPVATTVAVLDDYQGVASASADWSGGRHPLDVTFFTDHLADPLALAERLEPYEVLVLMRERTPLTAELISRLPRLRLIVTTGARNASIDVAAAAHAGVLVCGTRGLTSPTVELTWALVLAGLRDISGQQSRLRDGHWQNHLGAGLAGRTLGVLGLGKIGSRVARVGQAFDMDVVAWSQNLTAERADEVGARRVELDDLLGRSDVVTIHLRLSERTHGLIGASQLALMSPRSWLVNTSRAAIVDQTALLKALRDGGIAGAALDVFDIEPLPPEHPLRSAPNTVLTPHLGYVVQENYEIFYGDAVDDIEAFLQGEPIRVVNPG